MPGVGKGRGAPASRPARASRLRRWLPAALCAAVAAATLAAGAALGGRSYYLVGAVLLACGFVPFFAAFEARRPQARELAVVAAMCALAVASRVAFALVPHFKPMGAVVMVAGIALGARTGFLVGATSALASDLVFGLGPWAPWQMLAFGAAGLVPGLLADAGLIPRGRLSRKGLLALAAGGFALTVLVVGPILDTSSLVMMVSTITPASAAAIYLAGLPVNALQGAAAFLTLLLAANPLLALLARLRAKYGLLEA